MLCQHDPDHLNRTIISIESRYATLDDLSTAADENILAAGFVEHDLCGGAVLAVGVELDDGA